eukprot:8125300-Pyramimonas_sp.AAC.1
MTVKAQVTDKGHGQGDRALTVIGPKGHIVPRCFVRDLDQSPYGSRNPYVAHGACSWESWVLTTLLPLGPIIMPPRQGDLQRVADVFKTNAIARGVANLRAEGSSSDPKEAATRPPDYPTFIMGKGDSLVP